MQTISLTKGYETVIDDQDVDLCNFKWHFCDKGTSTCAQRRDYSDGSKTGKMIKLHRVIFERIEGRKLLRSELVDHKDNNPLNNARSNLRLAKKQQNGWNSKRPRTNTSGYKGVSWDKSAERWQVKMRVNGKATHIGRYDTVEEAATAYREAAENYRGEYARFE